MRGAGGRARPSYAAGALAAVVCLGALGGCGGDDVPTGAGPSSSSSPSAEAGTPSATPSSGPAEPTGSTAPEQTATPLDAAGFAEVVRQGLDPDQAADLSVQSGLGLLSAEGRIDFRAAPASLDLTLTSSETGDGQPVGLRVVAGVLYLADTAGFLSVEVDSPSNPFGASLTDQLDPGIVLDAVQASFTTGQDLGATQRDGQQLDLYRARAAGSAVLTAIAPDLAGQPDVVVPEEVVAEVGVDDDGLARMIRVDLGPENGALVYALDNWSTGGAVTAPPASEVQELDLPG